MENICDSEPEWCHHTGLLQAGVENLPYTNERERNVAAFRLAKTAKDTLRVSLRNHGHARNATVVTDFGLQVIQQVFRQKTPATVVC